MKNMWIRRTVAFRLLMKWKCLYQVGK